MRKSKILIHIPHSSLKMPKMFRDRLILDIKTINNENMDISDLYVDKLVELNKYDNLIFKYSRLFCDVERFADDNIERMSIKGMGCVYTHTSNQEQFISYDLNYKNYIIKNYYDVHHIKLNNKVSDILNNFDKCIIIDLHSFSNNTVKRLLNLEDNPDICIGYDEDFNYKELTAFTTEFFTSKGYSVKTNYPYSGSIVPSEYYNSKDKRVKSIMIELNKNIYLKDNEIDEDKFLRLKNIINAYLNIINEIY